MLPYSRQSINEADIAAVVKVLRGDWLTTGPAIERFEAAFCEYTGAKYAVAVSSGTAALHAAMFALGVGPGDEVIVPTMTFVATANAVMYQGATPVFCDVDPDTLLIDWEDVERKTTEQTEAIVPVDYAGQCHGPPIAESRSYPLPIPLVADCCHSLGASFGGENAGIFADLNCFSLHAVKPITCGEGGVVTTHDISLAERMRAFRNHGRGTGKLGLPSTFLGKPVTVTPAIAERVKSNKGRMTELGYNYRMTDFQAALATSQLARLDEFIARRREIAAQYDEAFAGGPVEPLVTRPGVEHGRHLYVVRASCEAERDILQAWLLGAGIQTAIHFPPVHMEPYYRANYGTKEGDCPMAENAARRILSLPIFPDMTAIDVEHVIQMVQRAEVTA